MKKVKIIFWIILIIVIVTIVIIMTKKYKPNLNLNQNNNQISSMASSTPTTYTVEEKTISDKNDFYEITAKYPKDTRDKNNVLENFVLNSIKKTQAEWAVGGELYNGEMHVRKDFPDRPKMTYTYMVDYKTYDIPNTDIVSYVLNTYQFTGGAHGTNFVTTFSFDKNGKIDIEDILDFANGNGVKLSKLLAQDLIKEKSDVIYGQTDMVYQGLGIAYLKADGTIDKEKCGCDGFYFGSNFQNFYLSNQGITFIFSQYQIAPGAAGNVELMMTWDELKPFLLNTKIEDLATEVNNN